MAYNQPAEAEIGWDIPGPWQGVTIRRETHRGVLQWAIPWNGSVPQALAAELLGVSTMAVNNWVRGGRMDDIKLPGKPSMIPLKEVKRIKKLLAGGNRLPPSKT